MTRHIDGKSLAKKHTSYGGEHSYADIGRMFGMHPNAVRSRIRIWAKKNPEIVNDLKAKVKDVEEFDPGRIKEEIKVVPEEDDPNVLYVSYEGKKRITSVALLLEACDVNPDGWVVHDPEIGSWEVLFKNKGEQGVVVTLYRARAKLIKKHPDPIEPIIRPLKFDPIVPVGITVTRKESDIKRALIMGDHQIGFQVDATGIIKWYHDRRVMQATLELCKNVEFDTIVIIGDMGDFAEWSTHFSNPPTTVLSGQITLYEMGDFLWSLRALQPSAKIVYMKGNHEKRIDKVIEKYIPQAYNLTGINAKYPLLDIRTLLDLDSLDIIFIDEYPGGEYWLNDTTVCTHGELARGNPGATAAANMKEKFFNMISGHNHRMETVSKTVFDPRTGEPETFFTHQIGCSCKIVDGPPSNKKMQNWQNGITVLYYNEERCEHPVAVIIENGKFFFEGVEYEGVVDDDAINSALIERLRNA